MSVAVINTFTPVSVKRGSVDFAASITVNTGDPYTRYGEWDMMAGFYAENAIVTNAVAGRPEEFICLVDHDPLIALPPAADPLNLYWRPYETLRDLTIYAKKVSNPTSYSAPYPVVLKLLPGSAGEFRWTQSVDVNGAPLEADTLYRFEIFAGTSSTSKVLTFKTAQAFESGTLTLGAVEVQKSPKQTHALFYWSVDYTLVRGGFVTTPPSRIEIMLKEDYDTYGWDGNPARTILSTVSQDQRDVVEGAGRVTTGTIRGNANVTGLRANREYVFRLRVGDADGGTLYPVYPADGQFKTFDYSTARPDVSNEFTFGVY
jgi:hypothetical protein